LRRLGVHLIEGLCTFTSNSPFSPLQFLLLTRKVLYLHNALPTGASLFFFSYSCSPCEPSRLCHGIFAEPCPASHLFFAICALPGSLSPPPTMSKTHPTMTFCFPIRLPSGVRRWRDTWVRSCLLITPPNAGGKGRSSASFILSPPLMIAQDATTLLCADSAFSFPFPRSKLQAFGFLPVSPFIQSLLLLFCTPTLALDLLFLSLEY